MKIRMSQGLIGKNEPTRAIDNVSYGRILSFESKNQIFLFLWNILAKLCNGQNVFITLERKRLWFHAYTFINLQRKFLKLGSSFYSYLVRNCMKDSKSCVKIEQHENEMEYEINIDECWTKWRRTITIDIRAFVEIPAIVKKFRWL